MPGGGGSVAAFLGYNEAKRWSRHPEEFGKGSPEGIAAPEAANNTVACTALVPMLTFGIPGSNSTAVLLGGLLIHGLQPGPMLFVREPEFIYGLYGGLAVANVVQIPLGMLIMTPCLWLVSRPKPYLLACIYALVFSGVYSINQSLFDLWIVLGCRRARLRPALFRLPVPAAGAGRGARPHDRVRTIAERWCCPRATT